MYFLLFILVFFSVFVLFSLCFQIQKKITGFVLIFYTTKNQYFIAVCYSLTQTNDECDTNVVIVFAVHNDDVVGGDNNNNNVVDVR